uniref:Uncharacterized protein n=1 Tax=mine drainage metagenome TaxID=410659 RepID=E6QM47_9ZZZZ
MLLLRDFGHDVAGYSVAHLEKLHMNGEIFFGVFAHGSNQVSALL